MEELYNSIPQYAHSIFLAFLMCGMWVMMFYMAKWEKEKFYQENKEDYNPDGKYDPMYKHRNK